MKLIWHGTASIELLTENNKILFDPFVPTKRSRVNVKIEDFDNADYIFVTHGHLDHIISIPSIVRRNPRTTVFCTVTPYKTLISKGVPDSNLRLISDDYIFETENIQISAVKSKHAELPKISNRLIKRLLISSSVLDLPYLLFQHLLCRENNETVMYNINFNGKNMTILGSLNIDDNYKYLDKTDYLILPYNGWDDNYQPSIKVISKLNPVVVLLDHYDDTFPPITYKINLDPILSSNISNIKALELNTENEII